MNHTLVAGHLGKDPEVRFTSKGQKVTSLLVAGNQKKGGKEETIWWKVTIWGDQFDNMVQYLKKGSPVMAMGTLAKPEIFMDKEGKPQVSLNLTATSLSFSPFGKPKGANENASHDAKWEPSAGAKTEEAGEDPFGSSSDIFSEEEIPF